MSIPLSTYRLQMRGDFPFSEAQKSVAYLSRLGIGDLYLSPVLLAKPGSPHGYDICDHNRINPELGGDEGFDSLSESMKTAGLGCIIDIVPNHMGAEPKSNSWWWDVLENGPSSPYSAYFDIDWKPLKRELKDKVLLPVLGDQYGRVLERGEMRLGCVDGAFILQYFDHQFPINPRTAPLVLDNPEGGELGFEDAEAETEFLSILTSLRNLPTYLETEPSRTKERQREKEVAKKRLAGLMEKSREAADYVARRIEAVNGQVQSPASFDRLHELLEHQTYRLAYWRTAGHEINYRRFFDINGLLGMRMENEEVVEATHALVIRLVAEGKVTGIRLDHIDGLYDPPQYLRRLRDKLQAAAAAQGPDKDGEKETIYVVVEKILCGEEKLPETWPVQGTTGYEFLNDVNAVFVDANGLKKLVRSHHQFTGETQSFGQEVLHCKRLILDTSLGSELNVLANILNQMSEADRNCRDFTLEALRDALREVITYFPIYRTYISADGIAPFDRKEVNDALGRAMRKNPAMESSIFAFLKAVLLPLDNHPESMPGASLPVGQRLDFTMRFQQLSGPVQAKGVEDTAFYRHSVLISLNDVGGEPDSQGLEPSEFHQRIAERAKTFPLTLLATATHDTKRGEDARARINQISHFSDDWRRILSPLSRLSLRFRKTGQGGEIPSRADEYLLYQTLVGCWPLESDGRPSLPERDFLNRILEFMIKAVREAKVHTSWISPNEDYEHGLADFIETLILGKGSQPFQKIFFPFLTPIAYMGTRQSLAQLVLKCACPGIPDIYQGTEFWDLSLVDPDNRRKVDYGLREKSLSTMEPYIDPESWPEDRGSWAKALDARWATGEIKQYVMARCLRWRQGHPSLFMSGAYQPLSIRASDGLSTGALAFARTQGDQILIVCVQTRLEPEKAPLDLLLPAEWGEIKWRQIFTGSIFTALPGDPGPRLDLLPLFQEFPVIWLCSR